MLLALEKKLLAEVRQGDRSDLPIGTLTEITVDRAHPSYGTLDGEPVTILGEANRVGFSPVTLLRDGDGEEAWIPKRLIRNTDPRLAPIAFQGVTRTRTARPAKTETK